MNVKAYDSIFYKAYAWLCNKVFSKISWKTLQGWINGTGQYYLLEEKEFNELAALLKTNHYIILTRRKCHLTTYIFGLISWIQTGKWSYWSHAFMNVEGDDVRALIDFKFLEAIDKGTTLSSFLEVFDCDSVALLAPTKMPTSEWTDVLTKGLQELGKPYDDLFALADDSRLSCVELCRTSLMASDDYSTNFSEFETMIKKGGNLTPQMFYDCPDFKVIYEVRK